MGVGGRVVGLGHLAKHGMRAEGGGGDKQRAPWCGHVGCSSSGAAANEHRRRGGNDARRCVKIGPTTMHERDGKMETSGAAMLTLTAPLVYYGLQWVNLDLQTALESRSGECHPSPPAIISCTAVSCCRSRRMIHMALLPMEMPKECDS
ncbi:hypothetical protein HPP92_007472 [Vanilla planifolia]|uniref:Uncharacterized protein n=1 Tax=Vanilla planifolia TaxID=51239 RepID=A0A835RA95_VANPL|nr:hypothetical protein HPP92_007472 [Vanilla planifolia]